MSGVIKDGFKNVLLDKMFDNADSPTIGLHNNPLMDADGAPDELIETGGYAAIACTFDAASGGDKALSVKQWTATDGTFPTVSGWYLESLPIGEFVIGEVDPANPVSVAENETYEVDLSVVS